MAVDVTAFLEDYPEFARVKSTYIEKKLTAARNRISESIWGEQYDQGVMLLAAHLIAMSPYGQHARLVPPNAKPERGEALTTYEREYKALMLSVCSGFRVTGGDPSAAT